MFGKNAIRKREYGDGQTLEVKEIFGTIQGEGPFAGHPAIFVRLSGCNLACYFCDTNFDQGERLSLIEIGRRVLVEQSQISRGDLVVLTGGEPLRQNIVPFVDRLLSVGFRVQIETAGTVWPPGLEDALCDRVTIVCSPKTGKVHAQLLLHDVHWKYLISSDNVPEGEEFPVQSTQRRGERVTIFRRPDQQPVYYQPMEAYDEDGAPDPDQTRANVQRATQLCLQFGHRLSLQQHKIIHLR